MTELEAKRLHVIASKEADKKGLTGERRNAYIYAVKRRAGWKPKREQ